MRRRFHVGFAPTYEAAHALKAEHMAKEAKEGAPPIEYQVRRKATNFEVVVRLDNQQAEAVAVKREEQYGRKKRRSKRLQVLR